MRGYFASTALGRVAPGEVDTIWTPRTPRSGYGLVLCHGLGNPNNFMDPVNQPASVRLAANIARRGIPCIGGAFGGDLWGNDAQAVHIDNAREALLDAVPSMDPSRVLLLGISHGGAMAVRYALERPTEIAGLVGIIPAVDIVALWETYAGSRATLGAAYGVTYPDPLPAEADTLAQAASLIGVPQLYGYSTVDPIVPASSVTGFAEVSGAEALAIDTVSGHTDAAIAKMPLDTVLDFLLDNGA